MLVAVMTRHGGIALGDREVYAGHRRRRRRHRAGRRPGDASGGVVRGPGRAAARHRLRDRRGGPVRRGAPGRRADRRARGSGPARVHHGHGAGRARAARRRPRWRSGPSRWPASARPCRRAADRTPAASSDEPRCGRFPTRLTPVADRSSRGSPATVAARPRKPAGPVRSAFDCARRKAPEGTNRWRSPNATSLRTVLATVAPGTPLRDGLERILRGHTGALIVIGWDETVERSARAASRSTWSSPRPGCASCARWTARSSSPTTAHGSCARRRI